MTGDDKLSIMDHFRGWLSQRRWGIVGRLWRRRLRQIDRDELFPSIAWHAMKNHLETDMPNRLRDRGRSAIAVHIYIDKAWRFEDEWKAEPEAEWYSDALKRVGAGVFGGQQ